MRLAAFIRQNSDQIIAEWEYFARTLVPAAEGMTPLSLRNHIIVAAHGGTIRVTSTERDGTTFTARFPRSRATALPAHDSVQRDQTTAS
jgi:hypothetical protein